MSQGKKNDNNKMTGISDKLGEPVLDTVNDIVLPQDFEKPTRRKSILDLVYSCAIDALNIFPDTKKFALSKIE